MTYQDNTTDLYALRDALLAQEPDDAVGEQLAEIEDRILDTPIQSVGQFVTKLQIVAEFHQLFGDVTGRLTPLGDQVRRFAAGA